MSARILAVLALVAILVPVAGCGLTRWGVEKPKYKVLRSDGPFQIRRYPPAVVAETEVAGERWTAANRAFSPLAGYIFGGNERNEKIAMTSPVVQRPGDAADGSPSWKVRFILPSRLKPGEPPVPKDPRVTIREEPATTYAVLRFRGRTGEERVSAKLEELRARMSEAGLSGIDEPTYAYYDPPWTPPFLRRNEILIEVADPDGPPSEDRTE